MKLLILLLLPLLLIKNIYAQQAKICEVTNELGIPFDILKTPLNFTPDFYSSLKFLNNRRLVEVIKTCDLSLNKTYIQNLQQEEGFYWRKEMLRASTKKDQKKYPNYNYSILNENDSIFIYNNKLYKSYKDKTSFPNWFQMKYSDFKIYKKNDSLKLFSDNLYKRIGLSTFYNPKNTLSDEIQTVDLRNFHTVKMKIIDESHDGIMFLTSDSLVVGYLFLNNQNFRSMPPMLRNVTAEKIRNKLKKDTVLLNTKLLPGDFNMTGMAVENLPYFKINKKSFDENETNLFLSFFNADGSREYNKDLKDWGQPNLKIYDFDCFVRLLQLAEIKRKKATKEYEEYLQNTFNEREIEAIKSNAVYIGMSESALYESVGQPYRTNTTALKGVTHKQCIYGIGIFVYVENGKVVGWQNLESWRYYLRNF